MYIIQKIQIKNEAGLKQSQGELKRVIDFVCSDESEKISLMSLLSSFLVDTAENAGGGYIEVSIDKSDMGVRYVFGLKGNLEKIRGVLKNYFDEVEEIRSGLIYGYMNFKPHLKASVYNDKVDKDEYVEIFLPRFNEFLEACGLDAFLAEKIIVEISSLRRMIHGNEFLEIDFGMLINKNKQIYLQISGAEFGGLKNDTFKSIEVVEKTSDQIGFVVDGLSAKLDDEFLYNQTKMLEYKTEEELELEAKTKALEEMEAAQRSMAEFERRLVESIAEGVIVANGQKKVLKANSKAFDLLRTGKVIGERVSDLIGIEFSDEDEIVKKEIKIDVSKTEWFIASVNASKVKLHDGESGWILSFRDITLEKEVDKMKSEFVSLASHQLKTPLTALSWNLELLEEDELTETQKETVDSMAVIVKNSIDLVSQLLNVSRLETGKLSVRPEPVKLIEFFENVVTEIRPLATKKSIDLKFSYEKEYGELQFDPLHLREIFINLLSNAIKYTPENGSVDVNVKEEGEFIVVSVTDSGYGIPEKDQESLFQKFFRASNAKDSEIEGTGLGLYMVKSLVEISGGKIWFESKEGEGTKFSFSLPKSGYQEV